MKFCTECDNLYYVKIDRDNADQLVYYCRSCGHQDTSLSEEGVVVLKTQYKKNEQKFNHMVNRYTKYDPTLPHTTNLKCPNEACVCNDTTKKVEADVIYMRYDDDNMKYLFICAHCDSTWKTDDNK
jgi:DNA-directed RNA polymerase subunit M/transcription elongation factor TFIIS